MTEEYKEKVIKQLEPIAPKWARRIEKCKITSKELGMMRTYDSCIVGEAWGSTNKYAQFSYSDTSPAYCDSCIIHAEALFNMLKYGVKKPFFSEPPLDREEIEVTDEWLKDIELFIKHWNEEGHKYV